MTDVQALQISYVPGCSQQAQYRQYVAADAVAFTPDAGSYYRHKVSVMLPGAIVGAVCLLAALAFLVWLLVLCCRPRTSWQQPYTKMWVSRKDEKGRKSCRRRLITNFVLVLLTLGVVGVATWGLTDSIKDTHHQVDTAWGLVQDASDTVQSIVNIASNTVSLLEKLSPSLRAVAKAASGIANLVPLLNNIVSVEDEATNLNNKASDVDILVTSANSSVTQIQTKGVGNIQKAQNRYEHKMKVAWNPWRPIVMAVLFGLLMLFAIVACCFAISRRFPRTTATFTFLLWLMTAIFFILGSGGLNGVFHIAKDACLYIETFAVDKATSGSSNSSRASTALQYYFGRTDISAGDVPYQIYGLNTTQLSDAVNTPIAQVFLGYLDNPEGQAFITTTTTLDATEKDLILALPMALNQLNSSIESLTDAVQVSAITPLYHQAKELICCQASDVLHKLWLAWTITGALAAALAILLTAHVINSVGSVSRGDRYVQQPTDSAAPGKGSIFREIRHQPGQYQPGQYSIGQLKKPGPDSQPSAPPMSA